MREIEFRAWQKEKMFYFSFPDYYEGMENPIWMQFTGLKDKNGKEIYEGDIVKIDEEVAKTFSLPENPAMVHFAAGGFYAGTSFSGSLANISDVNNVLRGEIIGNLYENPELLK